jgi:hypothetical protein
VAPGERFTVSLGRKRLWTLTSHDSPKDEVQGQNQSLVIS